MTITMTPPFSSTVQFFGQQTPLLQPATVTITQQEFAHDMVSLSIWADDVTADSYLSGMPVILTWGRVLTGFRYFYGYVNHASRSNAAFAGTSTMDRNSTTVVCVGASWPMKQTGTLNWKNQTASQVVEAIAAIFNLDADVTPDITIWPTLQMGGMTYWEFCVSLAQRIGYTFFCSGIQLVFKPRQTNPQDLNGLVATYDYRTDPMSMPVFNPTIGADSPMGGRRVIRQGAGINPRTTQVVNTLMSANPTVQVLGSIVDTPSFTEVEHFSVRSQQELTTKTAGLARSNQLYLTATAQAAGDALIAQGSLVYVCNANGSQNGLWFVEKVVHSLNAKTYTSDLTLGRDSRGASVNLSTPPQVATPPAAILSNSAWVAA